VRKTIKYKQMKNEVRKLLKKSLDINKILANEVNESVLGISEELDAFFKNENEGRILLGSIYRYLIRKNANECYPDNTGKYNYLSAEVDDFYTGHQRGAEIMQICDKIKETILETFGVQIDEFYENGSIGITFKIKY